jgi:L-cysteine S-thiosulfotransferase
MPSTVSKQQLASGKQIAFQRSKGNCLACHVIEDGDTPGNIGPPLHAIQSRFKTKEMLKQFIWNAPQFNPRTSMPPFGKNKILTEEEINLVVDYIWTL